MKTIIPFSIAAALAASGISQAQITPTPAFSKPSGYVTHPLSQGFNPVGFTLQLPATTSGILTGLSATNITDSGKNFSSLLVAGALYTLEITSGSGTVNGLVTEVSQWTGSQLTTTDNLVAAGVPSSSTYTLRKAGTLQEIFGTTESVLTKNNAVGNADVVWVPDGGGGYTRYHQRGDGSWRNANTGATPVNNTPLVFLDGVFIQRRGVTPVDLVLTGTVKTTPTISSLTSGFNFYATVYPVGSTLQNLGVDDNLTKNNAVGNADVVWIPNGLGGYERYHMRSDGSWRNAGTGAVNLPPISLTSAIFIQRRAGATPLTLTPPASYSNL